MNKLMNKKVNMFGKEVSVFALVAVAMIGLATAALVPYISNSVSGTVSVSSPLTLSISKDNSSWHTSSVTLDKVYGFDSLGIYYKLHNNGNKVITANATIIISNSNGDATCEDFSNMTATVEGHTGYVPCTNNVTGGTAILTSEGVVLSDEQTGYATFNVTFEGNVKPATYTFTGFIPAEGSNATA